MHLYLLPQFQGLEGRENLARDLGIIEAEGTVGGPLLLEVIRRCQQKEKRAANGEVSVMLVSVIFFYFNYWLLSVAMRSFAYIVNQSFSGKKLFFKNKTKHTQII